MLYMVESLGERRRTSPNQTIYRCLADYKKISSADRRLVAFIVINQEIINLLFSVQDGGAAKSVENIPETVAVFRETFSIKYLLKLIF